MRLSLFIKTYLSRPVAYEEVKSFFIELLICFEGEGAFDHLIKPTDSVTVLYTRLARDIHKTGTCALCRENHFMSICSLFEELDFRDRVSFVADNYLCSHCFGEHLVTNFSYVQRCEYCKDIIVSYTHIFWTFSIVTNIIVQRVVVSYPLNNF